MEYVSRARDAGQKKLRLSRAELSPHLRNISLTTDAGVGTKRYGQNGTTRRVDTDQEGMGHWPIPDKKFWLGENFIVSDPETKKESDCHINSNTDG
jgi:hypothetical protein